MKAIILALAVFLTTSVSSAAFVMSHSMRGCSFWSYSSSVAGYVCSSPDTPIQVPDAYEIQRYISDLELKNQELERRIQALEAKLP